MDNFSVYDVNNPLFTRYPLLIPKVRNRNTADFGSMSEISTYPPEFLSQVDVDEFSAWCGFVDKLTRYMSKRRLNLASLDFTSQVLGLIPMFRVEMLWITWSVAAKQGLSTIWGSYPRRPSTKLYIVKLYGFGRLTGFSTNSQPLL